MRWPETLQIGGRLALWIGFYAAGVIACVESFAGLPHRWAPALAAGCTAVCVYLFDRSRWGGRPRDPADERTHPERVALLRSRSRLRRGLMLGSAFAAVLSLWAVHPAAVALLPASCAGALFYSTVRIPTRRLKDRLVLKNATVGATFVSFAVVLAAVGDPQRLSRTIATHWEGLAWAWGGAALFVAIDALVSDVRDREGDSVSGVRTVPAIAGVRTAKRLWIALEIAVAILVFSLARTHNIGWSAALLWGAGRAVTAPLLALRSETELRHWVELRMFALACLSWGWALWV